VASPVRWRLADDTNAQGALFDADAMLERHVGRGEFRGLEFLHVNARRIINEVPAASRMPFRYTINAYRGCSHACSYCAAGETPVLMANGATKPIGEVCAGDEIRAGDGRLTEVLAQWATTRPAHRVTLDDGRALVTSPDHRLLGVTGWVRASEAGAGAALVAVASSGVIRTRKSCPDHSRRALAITGSEPLGLDMPMYDITTGTGDFIANGVVSHNCFARPTHAYLDLDIGHDFDTKIVVKVNAVDRLRAELHPKRWGGHHIAMGTNTDPYQRAEGKYHLTRGIIEALTEAANPFSILTKSTLILRDLELLQEAARRAEVQANFSIGTLDEEVWKLTEPGTPHPRQRVEAVAKLNAVGIPCGVLVAPILPGLSDRPEQVAAVTAACRKAGATSISCVALHLRKGVREHFMGWLAEARPDLVAHYERLYRGRAYLPKGTLSAR
jgi:DNA repair photolyase